MRLLNFLMEGSESVSKGKVNEIFFALYLLQKSPAASSNYDDSRAFFVKHRKVLKASKKAGTYDRQWKIAFLMSQELEKFFEKNDYGTIKKILWTGTSGVKKYIPEAEPADHPADILVKFLDGRYLGLSLKSYSNEKIELLNTSLKTFLDLAGKPNDIYQHFVRREKEIVEQLNLDPSKFKRIITPEAKKEASKLLKELQFKLTDFLKSLPQEEVRSLILKKALKSYEMNPPYRRVKFVGSLTSGKVSIEDPLQDKVSTMVRESAKLEFLPAKFGTNIYITSKGKRLLTIRVRYSKEPFKSGISLRFVE